MSLDSKMVNTKCKSGDRLNYRGTECSLIGPVVPELEIIVVGAQESDRGETTYH